MAGDEGLQELLDLARDKSLAGRNRLTEMVTNLFFDTDRVLSDRERATMAYPVEKSKRIDSYQNPLLHRPDLGPDLAKRMYW